MTTNNRHEDLLPTPKFLDLQHRTRIFVLLSFFSSSEQIQLVARLRHRHQPTSYHTNQEPRCKIKKSRAPQRRAKQETQLGNGNGSSQTLFLHQEANQTLFQWRFPLPHGLFFYLLHLSLSLKPFVLFLVLNRFLLRHSLDAHFSQYLILAVVFA